jgi:pilus assembly protein Flp/PilA
MRATVDAWLNRYPLNPSEEERLVIDRINTLVFRVRSFVDDEEGQDMVEYALLASFVAVAAGALLPAISSSISTIFSRMGSVLSGAAA